MVIFLVIFAKIINLESTCTHKSFLDPTNSRSSDKIFPAFQDIECMCIKIVISRCT